MVAIIANATTVPENNAEELYKKHCKKCHGMDGTKEASKAKNLQISSLPESAVINIIKKGKGKMKAYEDKLTDDEIKGVAKYVMSLRK